jgi:hypothetical protein
MRLAPASLDQLDRARRSRADVIRDRYEERSPRSQPGVRRMARTLIAVFALALAAGCSCERIVPLDASGDGDAGDAGDHRADATPDAFATDGGPPLPGDVVCGAAAADPTRCITQAAAAAADCGGSGAVVFDGTACALALGEECTAERGAFDSFADCAVSCELAGHCREMMVTESLGAHLSSCLVPEPTTLPCAGIGVHATEDLTSCTDLDLAILCHDEIPGSWWCGRPIDRPGPADTASQQWRLFRQLSLMPFVDQLNCGRDSD